jgi:hypothetical protein
MRARIWTHLLAIASALVLAGPIAAGAAQFGRGRIPEIWQPAPASYEQGYQEGIRQGEEDARRGRRFDPASSRRGRNDYGLGYAAGYGTGYDRQHASLPLRKLAEGPGLTPTVAQRAARLPQNRAFEAGYEVGREKGFADGRAGERYDPVRHQEYRDAAYDYKSEYGDVDAYRNNFRAGFRRGYEEGYRLGTRNQR